MLKRLNHDKYYDPEEQHDRCFVKPAIEYMTTMVRVVLELEKHFATNDVINNQQQYQSQFCREP